MNKVKNRPKLEYSDIKKIKAFINKELEKNNKKASHCFY